MTCTTKPGQAIPTADLSFSGVMPSELSAFGAFCFPQHWRCIMSTTTDLSKALKPIQLSAWCIAVPQRNLCAAGLWLQPVQASLADCPL